MASCKLRSITWWILNCCSMSGCAGFHLGYAVGDSEEGTGRDYPKIAFLTVLPSDFLKAKGLASAYSCRRLI